MQRSSETIGAIAAALAKAQIELTNPEKSLTGTVNSESPREDGRSFRYAPLSSGLEIVRKCLGKHEIAAVQSTAIDKEAALIRLTTTLAHASGEWMSSEWPVCSVSETSAPHRLGAALTYARRHALFTLVGIAGDDDTDAPAVQARATQQPIEVPRGAGAVNGAQPTWRGPRTAPGSKRSIPSEVDSAARRHELLAELAKMDTAEKLSGWAKQTIPAKNALLESDARVIETAFAKKATELEAAGERPSADESEHSAGALAEASRPRRRGRAVSSDQRIDKSVLAFPEPRRIRDKEHLRFVGTQPCLICGRSPSDAHHIRFAQLRALGRKVSDEFTVPLCRGHHRQLHQTGDEAAFWKGLNLDPLKMAFDLWEQSRAPGERIRQL